MQILVVRVQEGIAATPGLSLFHTALGCTRNVLSQHTTLTISAPLPKPVRRLHCQSKRIVLGPWVLTLSIQAYQDPLYLLGLGPDNPIYLILYMFCFKLPQLSMAGT